MRPTPFLRHAGLAVLVVSILAASGCSWFRKNSPYKQPAETRPLEVPPDLDRPDTAAAVGTSSSVTRSSMAGTPVQGATATAAAGFTISGEPDAVFNRVGEALGTIPGVTVASKAQLLGTYDVNYEGSNFLVRVTRTDAGSYVSAVDPRGVAAGGEAPARLLAALKTALGV
jgi:uncharacterized lipoprotein